MIIDNDSDTHERISVYEIIEVQFLLLAQANLMVLRG